MKRLIHISLIGIGLSVIVLVALVATAGQDNPLATPPKGRAYVPSHIIFPDQEIPIRFFHDKHLAEDIDCTMCHDAAESSISANDILVPVGFEGEEICTNCHDFESGKAGEPPAACTTCHVDFKPEFPAGVKPWESTRAINKPASIHIPKPNLKMNHKVHIDKGIACARCHGDLKSVQVATRENSLPLMNTCMECHDGKQAPSQCRTCHLAKPDGRLINDFPEGKLMPSGNFRNDNHDDNYLRSHAQTAKGDDAYCANCHEDKFCLDCHNGVSRPMKVHPNNWVITHPMSARRNSPTCSSCHRAQTFCLDCHKRMKVVTGTEFNANQKGQGFDSTKFVGFHPPGWIGDIKKGSVRAANHHSFQAQRNIRTCAACHTEKTCVGCHSTSTSNISPHGLAFGKTAKCKTLRQNNMRVCTKCHTMVPECR